jgi:hypothetical protein
VQSHHYRIILRDIVTFTAISLHTHQITRVSSTDQRGQGTQEERSEVLQAILALLVDPSLSERHGGGENARQHSAPCCSGPSPAP